MEINPSTTQTHDLGLAAALVSIGFLIITTNRDANGRLYFVFRRSTELEKAIDSYWADSLDVKARTLIDNTKMLKGRIYGER